MTVYLEILEGRTPEEARPVLVTRDPAILRAVADALRDRLTEGDPSARAALEIVRGELDGGGEGRRP